MLEIYVMLFSSTTRMVLTRCDNRWMCVEVPTCNLVDKVHNKWMQQVGNKMTCLYEATMEDMIRAFMQIVNYRSWLKRGFNSEDPNSVLMKPKVVAQVWRSLATNGGHEILAGCWRPKQHGLCLGGSELFDSTKQKFNLPSGQDCKSHRLDKVNYFISWLNT